MDRRPIAAKNASSSGVVKVAITVINEDKLVSKHSELASVFYHLGDGKRHVTLSAAAPLGL